jgi:hypothetical protein
MQHGVRCILIPVLVRLGLVAFSSTLSSAQGGTGELTGLVTDQTQAVVAGAEATLTNAGTGEKRTETTPSAGIFRLIALPVVGSYDLEITAKGFFRSVLQNRFNGLISRALRSTGIRRSSKPST